MGILDSFKSAISSVSGISPKLDVNKRFETIKKIGYGTMSEFRVVKDRMHGNRICGLKLIDMEKLAQVEARWANVAKPSEGEISIQMDSPYIAETYEIGKTIEGQNYLLVEFVEGFGLNAIISTNRDIIKPMRLNLIRQGAQAIQSVHDAGFIHRDICPRNFIVHKAGKFMKLTDFGLSVPNSGVFLQPGNRTGTPNYMAPELVRRKNTDVRLDVFAYGVTIYETLTGQLPWPKGDTGNAALLHEQPPVSILQYRPDLDVRLSAAIMFCIDPDMENRCPTLQQFLEFIKPVKSEC